MPTSRGQATRLEGTVVYAAGAVQGIVLVTFPAASTILISADDYDLSSTQYGALFLPQVLMAISASLCGAVLGRRIGLKAVLLAGLTAGLIAMALLLASTAFTGHSAAFAVLLAATTFVGLGFGLTVPALNSLTAAFHPGRVDTSVLLLNALLGVGTVLAPLFVALFIGLGFWWGLPLTSAILLVLILAVGVRLPFRPGPPPAAGRVGRGLPARFGWYAAFAVLYGICETINGNWAQVDMTDTHHASTTTATLALTVFWAMLTVGRVLFASVIRITPQWTYHFLPFLLVPIFLLIAALPTGRTAAAIAAFGLAGLGCSALLPLTISFGQAEMAGAAAVAGGVIAFYQVGYGIAAFGVGPLLGSGIGLPQVYRWAAVVAAALGVMSFAVAGYRRARPSEVRTDS